MGRQSLSDQVTKHEYSGPVPHYVTLKGMGREVKIGAFLNEEDRIELYGDLARGIKKGGLKAHLTSLTIL